MKKTHSIVINVKRLWLSEIFMRRYVRGLTLGAVILLSEKSEESTIGHESIHIQQFKKFPLIFPIFYCAELIRCGYKNNKYEKEARKYKI